MAVNFTVYYRIENHKNSWEGYETVFASTKDEAEKIARARIDRKFGIHNGFRVVELSVE